MGLTPFHSPSDIVFLQIERADFFCERFSLYDEDMLQRA